MSMSSSQATAHHGGTVSGSNANQFHGDVHGGVINNYTNSGDGRTYTINGGTQNFGTSFDNHESRRQEDLRNECMRALLWTDPQDDLARTRDRTGGRTPGTCEWILENEDFKAWQDAPAPQALILTGEPGIGKTVMATFLIDRYRADSGDATFVYFLCSSTDTRRSTGISILRGIVWYLLRKHPQLDQHILETWQIKGDKLFEDVEALWPVFEAIVTDSTLNHLLLLLDGLDECEKISRNLLVTRLGGLIRQNTSLNLKLVTCSRVVPEVNLLATFFLCGTHRVVMDTGKVNTDLKRFVEQRVNDIAETNHWDRQLKGDVEEYINSRVGGTFIWVSLALKVASEKLPYQVLPKLKELSQGLKELYVRIFDELSDKAMAVRVLSLVIGAGEDPMSLDELAMALLFHPQATPRSSLPSDQEISDARAWPQSCAILLRISRDPLDAKVNLIHLTVQEFMEDPKLPLGLSQFRMDRAKAIECINLTILSYLCTAELVSIANDLHLLWNLAADTHGEASKEVNAQKSRKGGCLRVAKDTLLLRLTRGKVRPSQPLEHGTKDSLTSFQQHGDWGKVMSKELLLFTRVYRFIDQSHRRQDHVKISKGFNVFLNREDWPGRLVDIFHLAVQNSFFPVFQVLYSMLILFWSDRPGIISLDPDFIAVVVSAARLEKRHLLTHLRRPSQLVKEPHARRLMAYAMHKLDMEPIGPSRADHDAFELLFAAAREDEEVVEQPLSHVAARLRLPSATLHRCRRCNV